MEYKIKKYCPLQSSRLQVEQIQDIVERSLTELNYYEVLKSFILYRNERAKKREARRKIMEYFEQAEELDTVLREIQREYTDHVYHLEHLLAKFLTFYREGIQVEERLDLLKRAAVELTTQEAPLWEFAAARILHLQFTRRLERELENYRIHNFYEKIHCLTKMGLYGSYILENYSKEEILRYEAYMQEDRKPLVQLFRSGASDKPLCDKEPSECTAGNGAGDVSRHCHASGHAGREKQGYVGFTVL